MTIKEQSEELINLFLPMSCSMASNVAHSPHAQRGNAIRCARQHCILMIQELSSSRDYDTYTFGVEQYEKIKKELESELIITFSK